MAIKQFKQNDNNLAIAYYRYSSHSQNETSIDQQRKLAETYAREHGYNIVKEYKDEALSGTEDSRPEYQLMLHEVKKIKPSILIIYKTDRLARNVHDVQIAKYILREAGVFIHRLAEPNLDINDPTSIIIETLFDGMAEFYSANLRQNVLRGLNYKASKALYNGVKLLGYSVDKNDKYIIDEDTAPIVLKIYNDYANGKPLQSIVNDLNAQGLKTSIGGKFNINGLRRILHNRAYIGEYHYGDITVPGGMPQIVSEDLFKAVQDRFALNKHKVSRNASEDVLSPLEPRFWLTGKLYCGECLEGLQGYSGTSHTGKTHYYYSCPSHRKRKCPLKNIRKDLIESCVIEILKNFLADSALLSQLAFDISDYCKRNYADETYLKTLEQELKKTDKELINLVNAVKQGLLSDTIQQALLETETRKKALEDAIEAEKVKLSLAYDDHSIQHYFDLYAHADFDNPETRNQIFDYFIDKIYVFEDKLIIDMFFSDDHTEVDISEFIEDYDNNSKGSKLNYSGSFLRSFKLSIYKGLELFCFHKLLFVITLLSVNSNNDKC